MSALSLYWLFLRAVLLSFSGFATVPMLREALVQHSGVLTDARLNDAIAISQASPGPLGLYIVVVGYFVAGLPGAVSGVAALASPALLAIPLARLAMGGSSGAWQRACSGIVIASCALMFAVGLRMLPDATPTLVHLAIVTIGATVLAFTQVKPVWVIVVAAIIGLIAR